LGRRKRPSGRRRVSSSQRPDVFVDRSLGRRKVPDSLRESHPDLHVIAHDDLFDQDTDDEAWLREAGRRSWVVLTKDERIRRKPGEQRAIVEFGARCFCLHPTAGMRAEAMAEVLSRALPRMLAIAESEKRRGGFLKVIDRRGRIRHLLP
jgi:hypothetical protein